MTPIPKILPHSPNKIGSNFKKKYNSPQQRNTRPMTMGLTQKEMDGYETSTTSSQRGTNNSQPPAPSNVVVDPSMVSFKPENLVGCMGDPESYSGF